MLGWVMKRGLEAATGAPPPVNPDDTQIEQPDTPAPVFAARAFKTALFGTPAARDQELEEASENTQAKAIEDDNEQFRSPTKPTGILLTPGTGTTRRKRVSFGRDVKDYAAAAGGKEDAISKSRPRTKLTEALENARARKQRDRPAKADLKTTEEHPHDSEDPWEEVDDLEMDADVTVDLNEPHSQSGRYWKSEFHKYHAEAKAEMEKLVKYKHLAKSYAKMKDAEALDLNQKLREEQEKATQMERKVTELASRLASQRMKGKTNDDEMVEGLARQTALAVQYRDQVEELEILLKAGHIDSGEHGKRRRQIASPRTTKTLLDTQRELRKAREQVKELDRLRADLQRLKSDLRSAEQRGVKLEMEHKRIAADLSKSTSKIEELEDRLKRSEEECERKDCHLQKLKSDYNTLKDNAKARYAEAREVLHRKNEEIVSLKNENRSVKASDADVLTHDIKSLASTQHQSDVRSRKLADLRAKLKAEQVARQQRNEDTNIMITSLEAERKDRISDRTSARRGSGRSSSTRQKQSGDNREVASRILAERVQPEAPRPASLSMGRDGRKPSAAGLDDIEDQENLDALIKDVDARVASLTSGLQRPRPSQATIAEKPRSLRTSLHNSISGNRGKDFLPEVQVALDVIRPSSVDSEGSQIDLLQGRFKRLGGPTNVDSSNLWAMNTSRSALPPNRRAAAIARLEQKKAERKKAQDSILYKENVKL